MAYHFVFESFFRIFFFSFWILLFICEAIPTIWLTCICTQPIHTHKSTRSYMRGWVCCSSLIDTENFVCCPICETHWLLPVRILYDFISPNFWPILCIVCLSLTLFFVCLSHFDVSDWARWWILRSTNSMQSMDVFVYLLDYLSAQVSSLFIFHLLVHSLYRSHSLLLSLCSVYAVCMLAPVVTTYCRWYYMAYMRLNANSFGPHTEIYRCRSTDLSTHKMPPD